MRTIKFRGLSIKENKWVYGGYFQHTPDEDGVRYYIFDFNEGAVEVIPESVGQFTNVTHRDIEKYKNKEFDKNGNCFEKEVFEGDIVEFKADPSFYINAKLGDRYVIEYFGAGYFMKPISWKMKKINAQNYVGLLPPYQTSNMRNHYEVIGNIHENPELLN